MFCDGCGAAMQPGQVFCSKCGKQIVGPVSGVQPLPARVKGHLNRLRLMWFALSAFNKVGGIILYILGNTLFARMHEFGVPPETPTGFLRPLLSVVAIFILATAAS